jgi:hypothetical protein
VSFNVANTPEQIYWNQKKVREAMAKAGGILPNSISYYQVRVLQQMHVMARINGTFTNSSNLPDPGNAH